VSETVSPALQAVFEGERSAARLAPARDATAVRTQTVRMYQRLAEEQAKVIERAPLELACARGCNFCCHQRVEIRPYEAFVLAEFIDRTMTEAAQGAVRARLAANRARIAPLTAGAHTAAGLGCALLQDGVCSVYEARPAACRKYYSLSVDTCREAYLHPTLPLTGPLEDDNLRLAGNAVALGFARGVEESGRDANRYELHAAVLEALDNPKAAKRYRDGKKAFVTA
jgi:Fe-S-cluster containining protein